MNKKTVAISVCAAAAVVAGGMFGIYKLVVTPERIVELGLVNAYKDARKSFVYLYDNESSVLKSMRDGGRTEFDFTADDVPVLDTLDIDAVTNFNTKCSSSEIKLSEYLDIETYKDDEAIYVNVPMLPTGFMVPIKDFAAEWNASIFKDIITLPEGGAAASASDTASAAGDESAEKIKEIIETVLKDTEKVGDASVMVGSKSRKAKAYRVTITEDEAKELEAAIQDTVNAKSTLPQMIKDKVNEVIGAYNESLEITFKMTDDLKLRELEFKNDDGNVSTIAFSGTSNTMDTIAMYDNGDTKNASRRTHSADSDTITETITVGDKAEIVFENTGDTAKLSVSGENVDFEINASDKAVTDTAITFGDVEISVGDSFKTNGTISLSDTPDKDISFTKSGNYTDLLKITQEEWESILDGVIGGIELLGDMAEQ